jgi:hypothetical protein
VWLLAALPVALRNCLAPTGPRATLAQITASVQLSRTMGERLWDLSQIGAGARIRAVLLADLSRLRAAYTTQTMLLAAVGFVGGVDPTWARQKLRVRALRSAAVA